MSRVVAFVLVSLLLQGIAAAQQAEVGVPDKDTTEPPPAPGGGWMWMTDGALFATFNHQGGLRASTDFKSQNWFMTMASHTAGPGLLTLRVMLSAEPLTETARGYAELFQMGEAYHNLENIDYQHPHDLFSQLAASWRVPLGDSTGLTFAGGPVGEATLGPVAFMHRASASEDPIAPLSHHQLDSTHIVEGVLAVSLDHEWWTVEGSAFHGREPDEHRYDIETGALDSWATRVWIRPSPSILTQVSYGYLHQPEQLEPGDIRRGTVSASWTRGSASNYLAVTEAVGHNWRVFDTQTTAFLTEATWHRHANSLYMRLETPQVTSEHLLFPTVVHVPHPGELIDWLTAFTAGAVRDLPIAGPMEIGIGGDVTVYDVPPRLQFSNQFTMYGAHPVSFHIFLRIRPKAPAMGHMWDSTMTGPAMSSPIH
jgi:hypothetical protein